LENQIVPICWVAPLNPILVFGSQSRLPHKPEGFIAHIKSAHDLKRIVRECGREEDGHRTEAGAGACLPKGAPQRGEVLVVRSKRVSPLCYEVSLVDD
jgi:hypothetical protein